MNKLKRIHLILRNAGVESIYDVEDDYIEIRTDDGKFILYGRVGKSRFTDFEELKHINKINM